MSVTVSGVSVSMSGYVCVSMWCVCIGVRIGQKGISGGTVGSLKTEQQ